MTTEYTINYLYPKPAFDTRTWHDQMHMSLDMIDADMKTKPGLDDSNIWTALTTIYRYVDNGATAGPVISLIRESASPAIGDALGQIIFTGRDTAAVDTPYGAIHANIISPTNGAESGSLSFTTVQAGALGIRWVIGAGVYTSGVSGGDKGVNTLNVGILYENGVSLGVKYAALASPIFIGDPQAPTPAIGDNDQSIATTAFVKSQGYVTAGSAPVTSVAGKTGAVTLVKADVGLGNVDNTSDANKPVSTAQQTALNLKANINSPAFTGDARSTNPPTGDNDDSIATTQFVTAAVVAAGGSVPSNVNPLMDGAASPGIVNGLYSREDHRHPTDTSRYAASNPSNYQTAAQVAASSVAKAGDTMTGPLVVPVGSAAATSINFGTAGTGIWSNTVAVSIAAGGVNKFNIGTTALQALVPFAGADGAVGGPAYSFTGELTSGFYRAGAGDVRLSMGGADAIKILTSDPTYGGKSVDVVAGSIKEFGIPISQRYSGGYLNILRRNGGFEVWQRGAGGSASFAVAAGAIQYTADGWYQQAQASQALTVSQVAGLTNGSQYAMKVQRNAGQTGTGGQTSGFPLDTDEIFPFLGKFVRLSFTAKCGANFSPASSVFIARMTVGTGTPTKAVLGYTGSSNMINALNTPITTTAQRFEFTSSAVIPLATRQAEIALLWSPIGTAGADDSIYFDDVMLEVVEDANQMASPFERLNFAETLALCQRHYQKTFFYNTAPTVTGFAGSDTGEILWIAAKAGAVANILPHRYPVPMRVSPTVLTFNPFVANQHPRDGSNTVDCVMGATVNMKESGGRMGFTGNAATTVASLIQLHITLDAGI